MTKYFEIYVNGAKVYEGTPMILNTNDLILHSEGKRLAVKAMKIFNTNEITVTIGEDNFTYKNELYKEKFKA